MLCFMYTTIKALKNGSSIINGYLRIHSFKAFTILTLP